MYSLLLMTAMAGAPEASGFGWRSGGGCYGSACYGSAACYGSGSGSCYGGCTGYASCAGCTGSGSGSFLGHGILDRMRERKAARASCHGGCYGSGYGSCFGSGYGSACWGSCYGSSHQLGCGGFGSCYGAGLGCGGFGCGGAVVGAPAVGVPVVGAPAVGGTPMTTGTTTSGYTPADTGAKAPARLTIELPAGAKLYVDGALVAGTGASREFHTPELPAGQSFFYDLKAEVEVNGKVQSDETRVVVRAGEKVTATFPKLVASAAGTADVAVVK